MKKLHFLLSLFLLSALSSHAQIAVSKLLGSENKRYGLGYGLFTFFDFPFGDANQSIRVELADLAMYPLKGEDFFTTTADAKSYLSIKLGYRYLFSETQTGFYVIPSAGYCRVIDLRQGKDATYKDGFAAAVEGGYSLGIGQKGHTLNLGVKLETDRAGTPLYNITTLGLRLSYAFHLFGRREE